MAPRQRFEAPTDTGEQRECARGSWCSASTRDTEGNWHPAHTYQAFCGTDQTLITASAEALPKAYERLAAQIGTPARRGSPVRVPPGSRVLLNGDIDALIRLMYPVIGGWAGRVRAVPGLNLARPGHPYGSPEAVTADCKVLTLHTVPMLALAPGPMYRTWTWRAGSGMPPDLEAEIADLEILHIGDGWVRAITDLDGTAAGHDLLGLHRAAVRLLGETPAPVKLLDGIPCRSCEAMSALAVLEQPPPDPEQPPPPYVRCVECRDEMNPAEYREWTRQYAAWVGGSGILTCRRCELGLCGGDPSACSWASCTCRHQGRARAALLDNPGGNQYHPP